MHHQQSLEPPAAQPVTTLPRTRLILLVDDYTDALDLYAPYLALRGFRVVTATSGEGALRAAHQERPDLVLMDLLMAGMTGNEVMRALRTDEAFADVPIIAFTAHVLSDANSMMKGFDGVITKPCWPDDLVARIQPYFK